jgi:hypothetical protein
MKPEKHPDEFLNVPFVDQNWLSQEDNYAQMPNLCIYMLKTGGVKSKKMK